MVMIIGKEVARKFKLSLGDRVIVEDEPDNPRIWTVTKKPTGYKLTYHNNHLRLNTPFKERLPSFVKSYSTQQYVTVQIESCRGKLRLKLPGADEIQKKLGKPVKCQAVE
jgi:hypothetical protein